VKTEVDMAVRYKFASLEDFLISTPATVDGQLDDGWGALFPVKGREIEATILFADIPAFTRRTEDLTSTETLAFVNNFFAWISAEALRDRPCVIDKYIGDEIMVVFSEEFGAKDPFREALDAARWMGEHDVLDFQPQIGLASGRVTVGYVGTPLRYNCSVFGRPVAIAARCAKAPHDDSNEDHYSTRITFPAALWTGRDFATEFYPRRVMRSDSTEQEQPMTWSLRQNRSVGFKNVDDMEIVEIVNSAIRYTPFTAEERAREGVASLRQQGRYWPPSDAPKTGASEASEEQ